MEEGTPKAAKPLNERQQAFVREYVIDFNATQAAIRAGYSARSAGQHAEALMRKHEIQTAIQEAKGAVCKRAELTVDRIVQELERIAFGDLKNSVKWDSNGTNVRSSDELTDDVSATIAAIEEEETTTEFGVTSKTKRKVKVKHYDKLRALELLARYKGMLVDRKEITGKDGKPMQVQQQTWMDAISEATKK